MSAASSEADALDTVTGSETTELTFTIGGASWPHQTPASFATDTDIVGRLAISRLSEGLPRTLPAELKLNACVDGDPVIFVFAKLGTALEVCLPRCSSQRYAA